VIKVNNVIIVSGDGHATPLVPTIAKYLDKEFRVHLDGLIREDAAYIASAATVARPPRLTLDTFDDRGLVRSGGELGSVDPDIRVEQMDAEGITAELIHIGTQHAQIPFFGVTNGVWPDEVRAAGARAYHRWLAEFMAATGGRLFGVIEPGPCKDLDATIKELEWCAANGFVSVSAPGYTADSALPELFDAYFEPFWAACEDLGIVVSVHAGWGSPQVSIQDRQKQRASMGMMMEGDGETTGGHDFEIIHKMMQEKGSPIRRNLQQPRRPMWKLMAGGVFDRHPELKMALTEIRADWVPATFEHLDQVFADLQPGCQSTPSEYFRRHCLVVPSSPHRAEVAMRHEIGVDQFGFGQDYPHWEGLWPNTLNWLQHAFHGVPEAELRAILGGNAVRFYGLPAAKLQMVAEKIGPSIDDILGDHEVPDQLIQHFNKRAGYLRGADPVYADEIDDMLRPDLAALSPAAR
jgi:predicted TIM-barrel fold metal-dependent hydrolase